MTTKKKQNSKVPKSAKTRFSDLTPKNDARAGRLPVVDADPSGVATPDGSASTTGRRPARASFLGVRSLNLVLADFGTLLFCFFLVVIFYSLSFLFCFLAVIIYSGLV